MEIIIFLKSVISKKFTLHKVTHSEHMHEIEINNEYVKSFIVNNNIYTEENSLFYSNDDKIILKKYNLNSNPFFVIQLFSANGSLTPKNWGIENFNLLIHQLKRKFTNFKIVLVGDEGDNKKIII